MGQLFSACNDPKGEQKKASAFQDAGHADVLDRSGSANPNSTAASSLVQNDPAAATTTPKDQNEVNAQAERLKALREEQARLELIVSTAGRDMVAVRSMRGNTGYYDQGFAAALAQHLEQTANNTVYEPRLPDCSSGEIVEILARPQWEGIMLGNKGNGLAGCAGENPNTYMDHVAESLLESAVPAKEQLFVGVGPMVEDPW